MIIFRDFTEGRNGIHFSSSFPIEKNIKIDEIMDGCKMPYSMTDGFTDVKTAFLNLIPMRAAVVAKAQIITAAQNARATTEFECFSPAIDMVTTKLHELAEQILSTRMSGLTIAKQQIEEQIEVNFSINTVMAVAFAYLATRFVYSKLKTQPANAGQFGAAMQRNYAAMINGRVSQPPMPMRRRLPPGVEEISPTNRTTRSGRPSLQSQSFLWKQSGYNPVNRGGGPRRTRSKRTKRTKRTKCKTHKTRRIRKKILVQIYAYSSL